MSNYIIAIRREHLKPEEVYGNAPTESLAISRADRLFDKFILDSVAVVEIDKELITIPYKRTRKCKHTNIQYILTGTGIQPICSNPECKMVMIAEEMEEANETGRCSSS